ncbi:MAG: hypothetical protein Q8O57_07370, partial [Kiritimatiellota bacterium]|nr:hypothetical protein [Kiritimatiellota bacterium]
SLMQIQTADTLNSSTFLSKFQTPRLFYRSPEIIRRITREAISDAAAVNVRQAIEEFKTDRIGHGLQRMLAAGLNVTLNTDDPSVSQIAPGNEYQLACSSLGLSCAVLVKRILAAAQAAFLPTAERQQLGNQLKEQFAAL